MLALPTKPHTRFRYNPLIAVVKCDYCGQQAQFCKSSDHVYRKDYGPIWHCIPCRAWVGCHPDGKPLGRLATQKLRAAKIAAHNALDPLVAIKRRRDGCSKSQARKAAYRWLAGQLGIEGKDCHIGQFDEIMCARVIEVCSIGASGAECA